MSVSASAFRRSTLDRCLLVIGAAVLAPFASGVARAEQFYTFVDLDSPCDLALVDTVAGTTTVVGSTGTAPEGLAFGPDRVLYATVDPDAGCGLHGSADWLATVDPDTAQVTLLGGPIGFDDVDSLAFAPDGTLYGVAVAGHQLITIDTLTGAGTLVADLWSDEWSFNFVGAIEFLRDGTLIGADMANAGGGPTTLLMIDPTTGEATVIGDVGWLSVEGMSLGSDGRLFGMAGCLDLSPGTLIEIDPASLPGTFVQQVVADPSRFLDGLAAQKRELAFLDIKPGSCPNPFNRRSHGVLPVALVGTEDFDVTSVDLASLEISRADGIGGSAAPNEGPPGPHSVVEDVTAPFVGAPCACDELTGDGIMDLSMKFNSDEVVEALELDDVNAEFVELEVTGTLIDGTAFEAMDCIRFVPPNDIDGDGVLGVGDFLILLATWGPCPAPPAGCNADLDGDGLVGANDFLALMTR